MIADVQDTLNVADNGCNFCRPGFVWTGQTRHQLLHLDNVHVNFDKPYDALIVHLPLEKELDNG